MEWFVKKFKRKTAKGRKCEGILLHHYIQAAFLSHDIELRILDEDIMVWKVSVTDPSEMQRPNLKIHMQTTIQTEADQCGEHGTRTIVPLHSACLLSDRRSPQIFPTAQWDFTHTWALGEVRHTLQTAVCVLTADWTCGFLPSGGDYICAHNWGDNHQYAASSM